MRNFNRLKMQALASIVYPPVQQATEDARKSDFSQRALYFLGNGAKNSWCLIASNSFN